MSTPMTGTESGSPPPLPPPAPAYTRLPKNPILATFLSGFPGLGQVYNGQPAKAVVFFASDDASWLSGESLVVAGGLR